MEHVLASWLLSSTSLGSTFLDELEPSSQLSTVSAVILTRPDSLFGGFLAISSHISRRKSFFPDVENHVFLHISHQFLYLDPLGFQNWILGLEILLINFSYGYLGNGAFSPNPVPLAFWGPKWFTAHLLRANLTLTPPTFPMKHR